MINHGEIAVRHTTIKNTLKQFKRNQTNGNYDKNLTNIKKKLKQEQSRGFGLFNSTPKSNEDIIRDHVDMFYVITKLLAQSPPNMQKQKLSDLKNQITNTLNNSFSYILNSLNVSEPILWVHRGDLRPKMQFKKEPESKQEPVPEPESKSEQKPKPTLSVMEKFLPLRRLKNQVRESKADIRGPTDHTKSVPKPTLKITRDPRALINNSYKVLVDKGGRKSRRRKSTKRRKHKSKSKSKSKRRKHKSKSNRRKYKSRRQRH